MSAGGVPQLAPELVAVLKFAGRHANLRDNELRPLVRQAFGLDLVRYRQRLYVAISTPGAEAVKPAVVHRCKDAIDRKRRRLTPSGARA